MKLRYRMDAIKCAMAERLMGAAFKLDPELKYEMGRGDRYYRDLREIAEGKTENPRMSAYASIYNR